MLRVAIIVLALSICQTAFAQDAITISGAVTTRADGVAVPGAVVMTTRGGDFELHIGQDASIGYLNHTDTVVRLYLQETFTFLLLTSEAAVALAPPAARKS